MAEQEEAPRKKGGKKRLFGLLALIGAVFAILTFWRRRSGSEEEEFE